MRKLFLLKIVIGRDNCLLRIIIISYLNWYDNEKIILKTVTWRYNCFLRIIIISYLNPYNNKKIISIKNSYLKI